MRWFLENSLEDELTLFAGVGLRSSPASRRSALLLPSSLNLLRRFSQSENFSVPGGNSENQPVAFNPFVHGYKGPVDVSYPPYISPQYVGFFNAVRARGIPVAQDLSSGDTFGISWSPSTIVATNQTRESSQTAYRESNLS